MLFAAGAGAQPPVEAATNAVAAAAVPARTEAAEEPLVTQKAPTLFYIGMPPAQDKALPSILSSVLPEPISLPVTNSMVCTWIVAALDSRDRAAHHLENDRSARARAKRDGGPDRRLAGFDGQCAGAESGQMGVPVRDDVFHFHRDFQPDGFGSRRGQHRPGARTDRRVPARCRTWKRRSFVRPPATPT